MSSGIREKTAAAVHASPTAAIFMQPWRGFLIATIAAFFLAIIGAVGTDEAPILKRLTYWLVVMETGATLGAIVSPVIRGWGRLRHRVFVEGALVSSVIAVPMTIVLIGANTAFFRSFGSWHDAWITFAVVLMFSLLMTTINYATAAVDVFVSAEPPPQLRTVRLAARLPLRLQLATIQALEAEDHYLRVHTDLGSELILMRLSDAIAELDGLDGARCHRSWWVARSAVLDVVKRDGRAMLTLNANIEVPVSRTYLPALRSNGWLA